MDTFTKRNHNEFLFERLIKDTVNVIGDDFFPIAVKSLSKALSVDFVFISELCNLHTNRLKLLAICKKGTLLDNFEYDTANTPCEQVIKRGMVYYQKGIQKIFPQDNWLKDNALESYMAIALRDTQRKPIGHLGIAHDKPLLIKFPYESVLRFIASRAGAELERKRANEELQKIKEGK